VCVLAGAAGNIGRWIGIGYWVSEGGIGYWVLGIGYRESVEEMGELALLLVYLFNAIGQSSASMDGS